MKSHLVATSVRQKLHWVALSCCDKNRLCKRAFTQLPVFPRFHLLLAASRVHVFPRLCSVELFPAISAGFTFSRVSVSKFVLAFVQYIWCHYFDFFLPNLFQDKAMIYFFEHGRFPAERFEYPKKNKHLVVVILWNIILCLPLLWYLMSVILSGSITSLLIAATIALVGKLHQD